MKLIKTSLRTRLLQFLLFTFKEIPLKNRCFEPPFYVSGLLKMIYYPDFFLKFGTFTAMYRAFKLCLSALNFRGQSC